MENKNAVPEGHDPAAGDGEPPVRPAPATPDSEIPEFLKGPDPDEPQDAAGAPAAETAASREEHEAPRGQEAPDAPAAPAQEPAMDRDAWESEFSSASADDSTADSAVDSTADSANEPVDASSRADAREDATAAVGHDSSTDTTAYPATDPEASNTRALPAWDQHTTAAGERPADTERGHAPLGATAAGAGAGAGAGALAADGGPEATTSEATTTATDTVDAEPGSEPVDAETSQRNDAVLAAKRRGGAPRQPGEPDDPDAQRRHHAREAALTAKPLFARIVQTVLAIFFPFLLVIGAIRTVASSWFLWLEYHRPGFPIDAYGFSPAERLTYGNYGVDYINNSAPSAYLGNLVDGKGDPLFLGTEVSHMADVKAVIGITYAAGIVMAVLAVIICLYLGRRYAGGIRRAFFAGSVITLVAMIALTVLAVLNFETFFTDFHELFFAQGNWTFHANDTLIRLYPTQFWMDAGIVIAGLVLLVSLVFLITNWPTRKRRERARLRQSNRDLGLD
ncbi:TIGR01906 family membrane protein [Arthrobacter sp.]|uniref:TIGR01906 family membrane protein n=1 Tax=Arthrobacter sp. TaxID=1667 RepID=UPI003A8DFA7C